MKIYIDLESDSTAEQDDQRDLVEQQVLEQAIRELRLKIKGLGGELRARREKLIAISKRRAARKVYQQFVAEVFTQQLVHGEAFLEIVQLDGAGLPTDRRFVMCGSGV